MKMKKVINILMERDDMSLSEAKEFLQDCLDEIHCLIEQGDYEGAEWVWEHEVGLEVDYLMEVLV